MVHPAGSPKAARPPRPPPHASVPSLLPKASPPHATAATPLLPNRPPRPLAQSVAGSVSLFALPRSLSSQSLRPRLGLHAPTSPAEVDWISLSVVYWVTLSSEAARGLVLPSTWPYLKSLGGTEADLGLFVASFSAGRMATTVPLGYLSDNFSTGAILSLASLVQVIGHLYYAVAPSLLSLIISRIIVGFGSSTMSVCRAHLARAVAPAARTHHFAYLSALQFIGFAVLPGVGGLLAALPEARIGPLAFNGFTYPAYVLAVANLFAILAIHMLYFDPPRATPRQPPPPPPPPPPMPPAPVHSLSGVAVEVAEEDESSSSCGSDGAVAPDAIALIVCLLVNITFRGVVAELETVATPFLMDRFDIGYGPSSYYISAVGFVGLFVYLGFKPLARAVSDRDLVVAGLLLVVLGAAPLGYSPVADRLGMAGYVGAIGVLWGLAYPIGQTAVLSLFSKVLAGLPAGGFLGLFSASGSLARIVFALFAGKVWGDFGRDAVFASILGYVALATGLVLLNYHRLVSPVH